ncbi:hypothetical protein Acr_11g0016920 [Actinidia rufa]|uniref:Uncharacterized protein n=1 Tax=Actinidia rufa TaxID=165716 RepID=A0A7J0FG04_9ERIC|nr:hypothetical protein Acr_11g0016920 [Actinidia rufa]
MAFARSTVSRNSLRRLSTFVVCQKAVDGGGAGGSIGNHGCGGNGGGFIGAIGFIGGIELVTSLHHRVSIVSSAFENPRKSENFAEFLRQQEICLRRE